MRAFITTGNVTLPINYPVRSVEDIRLVTAKFLATWVPGANFKSTLEFYRVARG